MPARPTLRPARNCSWKASCRGVKPFAASPIAMTEGAANASSAASNARSSSALVGWSKIRSMPRARTLRCDSVCTNSATRRRLIGDRNGNCDSVASSIVSITTSLRCPRGGEKYARRKSSSSSAPCRSSATCRVPNHARPVASTHKPKQASNQGRGARMCFPTGLCPHAHPCYGRNKPQGTLDDHYGRWRRVAVWSASARRCRSNLGEHGRVAGTASNGADELRRCHRRTLGRVHRPACRSRRLSSRHRPTRSSCDVARGCRVERGRQHVRRDYSHPWPSRPTARGARRLPPRDRALVAGHRHRTDGRGATRSGGVAQRSRRRVHGQ